MKPRKEVASKKQHMNSIGKVQKKHLPILASFEMCPFYFFVCVCVCAVSIEEQAQLHAAADAFRTTSISLPDL